ncbi:MAG: aminoglycoside phosphotransferase family protein [Alphaproteobacteria bacterium]|nr:aminoglycoside phosphotransferase family protein [Alphaproteobacteria bacterium]
MKFERFNELENFIKNNKLFEGFVSVSEIYTGGSSYNFCVTTQTNKYLLKVMKSPEKFLRLKKILGALNILHKVADENFTAEEKILVMPFIDGHKISRKIISEEFAYLLKEQYRQLRNLEASKIKISASHTLENVAREIDEILQREKGVIFRIIDKLFWRKMKKCQVQISGEKVIIHGDFTENNILIDRQKKPHIIDFEQVQYGYAVEDWMYLLLQMSGFRKLIGSLSLLQNLLDKFSLPYNPDELLYGTQNFYWRLLLRRLHNNMHKRASVRKNICLLIILYGYFRVQKFLLQKSNSR